MTQTPVPPTLDRSEYIKARRQAAHERKRLARARARRRGAVFAAVVLTAIVAMFFWLTGSSTPMPATLSVPHSALSGPTAKAQLQLPVLSPAIEASVSSPGVAPSLPFPQDGQGAVAVLGSGVLAASPNEHPVPIASVTKIMTAYLTLQAHPLSGSENGPIEHFTAADHAAWIGYSQNDLSNVELVAGESLSERQLLEALMLPSADNVADWLARWVAGSEASFVARMNATALRFGMHQTHYADASGVNALTVSTASDQALLTSIAMRNPVLRSIVATHEVPFPVAGTIYNVNPALGVDGIVGVKSGFTQAASGCLSTAAWRTIGGRQVLVVAVALGQPYGLYQAAHADETMLDAATPLIRPAAPFGPTTLVAKVLVPWSHHQVDATISAPVELAGLAGANYASRFVGAPVSSRQLHDGWPRGSVIGTLQVSSDHGPAASVPVVISEAISAPPSGYSPPKYRLSLGVLDPLTSRP
jgi:D-alanyl-D-alanine carboxypeptidase (penicillin-binding protein 5/6)